METEFLSCRRIAAEFMMFSHLTPKTAAERLFQYTRMLTAMALLRENLSNSALSESLTEIQKNI
jgi:hypothetical protein